MCNSWAFFTLSETSLRLHFIRKCNFCLKILRDLNDLRVLLKDELVAEWFCCCVSVNKITSSDHSGFTDHQQC